MKKNLLTVFAAVALTCGLGACSSTNTETTTDATAEIVTTNEPQSAIRAGETGVANQMSEEAANAAAVDLALDTTNFAIVAASSNIFEILSSEMAQERATNPEVRSFASQMIAEHNKTSSELKNLAAAKNITLPNGPLAMHQRMLLPLTNTEAGKKFDERYMDAQVKAHKQAVSLFETASKNERDAELKAFAARHLPHLRMHLDQAKKTKDLVD